MVKKASLIHHVVLLFTGPWWGWKIFKPAKVLLLNSSSIIAAAQEDSTVNASVTHAEKISTFGSLKQQVCSLCNICPTALKIVHRGIFFAK